MAFWLRNNFECGSEQFGDENSLGQLELPITYNFCKTKSCNGVSMILCECGEIINGATFKDYIKTSANPSTSTIGHKKCGLIFDFYDNKVPKKYSSRKELKSLAVRFAEKNNLDQNCLGKFLVEVDRLKSAGKLSDRDILLAAYQRLENDSDITARL